MTDDQVHELVIGWLHDLLGILVIQDRQQVDRPPLPYGMLDLVTTAHVDDHVDDIGYRELDEENSEGLPQIEATPREVVEWTFLFMIYGEQGPVYMRRLKAATRLEQALEPLYPQLTLTEVSVMNSIPELIGEKWEPRAQVNISVRGYSSDGIIIDTIDSHSFVITER